MEAIKNATDALPGALPATLSNLPGEMDFTKVVLNGIMANMTLYSMLLASLKKDDKPFPKTKEKVQDEYDYVIVGAGTAGSVMANRLSEVDCVSVLLLEAGGYASMLTEFPSFARVLYGTDFDWQYKTTPQEHGAYGQIDNRVIMNSGKTLGGSSVINSMLYVRGNRKNYDAWEHEGCDGWSYKDVFPYFLKLEDNKNMEEEDQGYHATGGPMTFAKPKYNPELKYAVLDATKSMGYDETDINGRRQTGISDFQATIRDGLRCSTSKAYLVPVEDRPNLDIIIHAFALKILFKEQKCSKKKRAYAVEFDYKGEKRTVKARKEIIISSGTIRTPQILMLSGIGPREHLTKHNIPCIVDLPVGKNLQDHYAANSIYITNSTPIIEKIVNPISITEFMTSRSGPIATVSELTLLGFLDGLHTTKNTPDFPRQELYFGEYSTLDAFKNYNLKPETYAQVYAGHELEGLYICFASLLQPHSRGEILLNSTDPHDYPLINPNYYSVEKDLKDVVEGLRICDKVAENPAMQRVKTKFIPRYPNCEEFKKDDDKYYGCQAKTIITTFWHTVGTARMGHKDDPRSVVDPKLRVIGVDGLRVVNAAVMPIVPSGNTNVPTMMVAEKAADIIKKTITCDKGRRFCHKT